MNGIINVNDCRLGFTREAKRKSVHLPVRKVFGLFPRADELHNGKELLMSVVLFLLLQNKHKMMAKTRLHHYPVHRSGKIDISCQENDIFSWYYSNGVIKIKVLLGVSPDYLPPGGRFVTQLGEAKKPLSLHLSNSLPIGIELILPVKMAQKRISCWVLFV